MSVTLYCGKLCAEFPTTEEWRLPTPEYEVQTIDYPVTYMRWLETFVPNAASLVRVCLHNKGKRTISVDEAPRKQLRLEIEIPLVERKNVGALPDCVMHFSTNLNKQYYLEQLWALYDRSVPQSGVMMGATWSTEGRRQSLHVANSRVLTYKYNGAKQGQHVYLFSELPVVEELRDKVKLMTGVDYNFCLINFYTQKGNLGLHSDDENGLDPKAPIASLSFSHPCGRAFRFVGKKEHKSEKYKVTLESGDLLMMYPPCQQDYFHCVPDQSLPAGFVRVNLTFRQIKNV